MLSRSEAGKLGYEKSGSQLLAWSREKSLQAQTKYYDAAKMCKCGTIIPYERRANRFCSSSCAAKENNPRRAKRPRSIRLCRYCNGPMRRGIGFCSLKCAQAFKWDETKAKALTQGSFLSDRAGKRYLLERDGNCCSNCKLTLWLGKPITVFLDHINGHSDDRRIVNLRLLCPNCDSQMPTWMARNKGNGRAARRLRYRQDVKNGLRFESHG